MSPLNRRDPDFVPNIYFNYISVPSKRKLNVSTTFQANISKLIYAFNISLILDFAKYTRHIISDLFTAILHNVLKENAHSV